MTATMAAVLATRNNDSLGKRRNASRSSISSCPALWDLSRCAEPLAHVFLVPTVLLFTLRVLVVVVLLCVALLFLRFFGADAADSVALAAGVGSVLLLLL